MEEMTVCSPEHQEVFRRVWARVMGAEENCPDPAHQRDNMEGDMSCHHLEQLARSLPDSPQSGPLRAPQAAPEPANPCTMQLRRQVLEALEGWQFYRTLARRSRGSASRILASLAADQHQQARRLAAAYFLLTGVRYWPTGTLAVPAIPSLWGGLRQRHLAEQSAQQSFLAAAQNTTEPELPELYRQLAQACQEHCRQLRELLEQGGP